MTYGFIAWFMPASYTSSLDAQLDHQMQMIIKDLQSTKLEDSGAIWDYIALELHAIALLKNSAGEVVSLPGNVVITADAQEGSAKDTDYQVSSAVIENTVLTVKKDIVTEEQQGTATVDSSVQEEDSEEAASETDSNLFVSVTVSGDKNYQMTTKEYDVQFLDDPAHYTLQITGSLQAVNQAVQALKDVFPWLLILIFIISAFSALFCSRFIAKPVKQLSATAESLSQLDFSWRCPENRQDELGVLAHSLNTLAQKLSVALKELRGANQKLQDDIDRERELERKRLEFFSAVSHELKTPVTVIKGQLEGMQAGIGVYQDHDKYLGRSLQVVQKLEQMVQEILMISRMESTAFTLHRQFFNLTTMVQKQVEEYQELAQMKQQEILLQTEPELWYIGDSGLLRKAVSNLISNALRYSPESGHIIVQLRKIESVIELQVYNSGVQIPEESLPRLFEAFYRVEHSRNRSSGGSGLGLYLVRMIVELHHGTCQIKNTIDGVVAVLILPIQQDEMIVEKSL